jgi:C4-dicarboxylate-specific signal transduction histidine kinase
MKARGTRLLLTVTVASAVGAGAVFYFVAAMALSATGKPSAVALAAAVASISTFVVWVASAMLVRRVARPVERILDAAEMLQGSAPGHLPLLGDSGHGLDQAALAFERAAAALIEERARLAAKVDEMTRVNRALADARESLFRSEKLATVGRLAAGVAHEVGNPLGAIAGYAEVARSRLPPGADPDLREALDRIAAAADRIDHTVRGLLDFARPAPNELRPVSVATALEAAMDLARVHPRLRGVDVVVELSTDLPPVLADERQLCQVFLNLLLNAGDAMEGQGRVEVVGRAGAEILEVRMMDTGPGIAPQDFARLFDPFFTTKDPGAGSGLGLAICHSIVESFGGSIDGANAARGGAVFTLHLRVAGR